MADPLAHVRAVLAVCGIADGATQNRVINNEGFTSLDDFGIMETDSDVADMAKRLAARSPANTRVNLGTVQIKKIQALIWWIRDRTKHGLALDSAEFTPAVLVDALEKKRIQKEQADAEVSVKDLGKFNPDDFDVHEDAFLNMLSQSHGSQGETLRYVVRAVIPPATFVDEQEERRFQLPLIGAAFDADNRDVYRKLKSFLINTAGWAWIEPFSTTENGRRAFLAWSDHYNGQGELSKRTSLAKARLQGLHYKNEQSMPY